MKTKAFCVIGIVFLIAFGCTSEKGVNDEGNGDENGNGDGSDNAYWTITMKPMNPKIYSGKEIKFSWWIDPLMRPKELVVITTTSSDKENIHLSSFMQDQHLIKQFDEGQHTFHLALYDSLEYVTNADNATERASVSTTISVKDITVGIDVKETETLGILGFTAESPEQDHVPTSTLYSWYFGDQEEPEINNNKYTSHEYVMSGEYQVIVTLSDFRKIDDTIRSIFAADTTMVVVSPNLPSELELVISPQDTTWNTAWGLTLNAETNIDRLDYPDKVKWIIDYDDGEKYEVEDYLGDRRISHRYYNTGTYNLHVEIYDLSTNQILAEDSAVIRIDNLPFISQTTSVYVFVKGYTVKHYGSLDEGGNFTETSDLPSLWGFGTTLLKLKWNGASFTAELPSTVGTQTTVVKINGTIKNNGETIERLEYSLDYIDTDLNSTGIVKTRLNRFVLENVPIEAASIDRFYIHKVGAEIGNYITEFESWEKTVNAEGKNVAYNYYSEFEWQNTTLGDPELTIEFKKE